MDLRAVRENEAPQDPQELQETRATQGRTDPRVLMVLLGLLAPLGRGVLWDYQGREEREACLASQDLLVLQESKEPQVPLGRRAPQDQWGLRD